MNEEKNNLEGNVEEQNSLEHINMDTNNTTSDKTLEDDKSRIEKEIIKEENNFEEKIKLLENQLAETKERLIRKAAEFENYKRRTENEIQSILKYASEPIVKKILTIADDFERSLSHIKPDSDSSSIAEGVKLIYDKFMKILGEFGIEKIESVGKNFDVTYHEALLQQSDPTQPPHVILQEILPGYMYKDKVIRHAQVIVNEDNSTENIQEENEMGEKE